MYILTLLQLCLATKGSRDKGKVRTFTPKATIPLSPQNIPLRKALLVFYTLETWSLVMLNASSRGSRLVSGTAETLNHVSVPKAHALWCHAEIHFTAIQQNFNHCFVNGHVEDARVNKPHTSLWLSQNPCCYSQGEKKESGHNWFTYEICLGFKIYN